MMVSTEEQHHFANSGTTLPNYFREAERCIKKCADAGIKMCGTVSTIWGSPIGGATDLKDAVEFTKYWLSIGASDIEHADHDGSASAADVYRYFSMILDEIPDTKLHIAHFHETKRVASASVLAALQAGICHFEATLVQIDEMGIAHGYDVDRILWLGRQLEKTVGTKLRSEAIINGRTLKEGHMHYARPGLAKMKEKMGEKPGQSFPV